MGEISTSLQVHKTTVYEQDLPFFFLSPKQESQLYENKIENLLGSFTQNRNILGWKLKVDESFYMKSIGGIYVVRYNIMLGSENTIYNL